jgi:small-conductance mechanosensitive channel
MRYVTRSPPFSRTSPRICRTFSGRSFSYSSVGCSRACCGRRCGASPLPSSPGSAAFPARGELQRSGTQTAVVSVLANGVYFLVLLVFVLAAVHLLQLPFVRTVTLAIGAYLPHLVAATIIVTVGYVAGGLARGAIARSTRSSGVAYGDLLGRIVQSGVVIVALIVAVDELGIDNTFLVVAASIILAATLGGAAVAFGLGARTSVGNLLASHYVQRNFSPGHVVRIGEIEGRILEIGETSVVLETLEGRVHIPARLFSEQISTLLTEGR